MPPKRELSNERSLPSPRENLVKGGERQENPVEGEMQSKENVENVTSDSDEHSEREHRLYLKSQLPTTTRNTRNQGMKKKEKMQNTFGESGHLTMQKWWDEPGGCILSILNRHLHEDPRNSPSPRNINPRNP